MTDMYVEVDTEKGKDVLKIDIITFELRTSKFEVLAKDKSRLTWVGHAASIDLAILDLCRTYQREKYKEKDNGQAG